MTQTTNTQTTPNVKQTPAQLREELINLSASMRIDPLYPQVEAHIAAHDELGEGKPLRWVLDACDPELDVMRHARMIKTAVRVFNGIVGTLEAKAIIDELEAARAMIIARDTQLGHVLNGWVAHSINNPGDLTRANKRTELGRAIEKAHKVFSTVEKINAKASEAKAQIGLFERVLEAVAPWWGYGWDAELERDEDFLVEKTSNQGRPYSPWKVAIIDEALAAKSSGTLESFLVTAGKAHGLALAVTAFSSTLTRSGESLFDDDHELRKQFEAILKGDEKKATASQPSKPAMSAEEEAAAAKKKADAKARQKANRERRAAENRAQAAQHPKGAKPGLFTKKK